MIMKILLSALLFTSILVVHCEGIEYTVHPSHCSDNDICFILEDYIRQSHLYFISHNKFVFLPGNHNISSTLIIDSVANLTLEGINSTKCFLLATGQVKIVNSSKIVIKNLCLKQYENDMSINSTLNIENSSSILIKEFHFFKSIFQDTMLRAATIFNSTVIIIKCSFYGGYSDQGGALKIDSSKVNYFDSISFRHNRASLRGTSISSVNSELVFHGNVIFYNNIVFPESLYDTRQEGGAIYALSSTVNFKCLSKKKYSNESSTLETDFIKTSLNCHVNFSINYSQNGGAIFSYNSTFLFEGQTNIGNMKAERGAIYSLSSFFFFFGQTTFRNNNGTGIFNIFYIPRITGGALTAYYSTVEFLNVTFQNNSGHWEGGGICLVQSELIISGTVKFLNNEARVGGGMYLETSRLIMKPPVELIFDKNKANYGGAIMHVNQSLYFQTCIPGYNHYEIPECFYNVIPNNMSLWNNIHWSFSHNVAISGSDIFGGNLYQCRMNSLNQNKGSSFIMNVCTFNPINKTTSISSNPLKICFCKDQLPQCLVSEMTYNISHGQILNVSVIAVGQNNGPVPSEIIHSFTSSNGAQLLRLTSTYNDTSTSCQNLRFRLLSKEHTETFYLYPALCKSILTEFRVKIQFSPCPPGFELVDKICKCDSTLKGVVNSCNIETGLVPHPGKIWIQPLIKNMTYVGYMWSKNCPSIFCRIQNSSDPILLNFSTPTVSSQCLSNRTGIMCGNCKKYYSVTLDNFSCHECNNSFFAMTIIFVLAGIALIIVLLVLHISVASGIVNGLILYANIFNISKDLFFPSNQIKGYFLPVFISWLNLDFGISTCYFNGLNFYTYAWLQFAFPFYLWALIGIFVIICRYFTNANRLFGSNPIAVLATVILMSYTKLLHASNSALEYTFIKYFNGTEKKVWKWDPSISYFEGRHILLAVFSICVLIFLIIPYIIIVLMGYHLQAFSYRRKFFWINKLKPLLDSYYAPYQKHTRFWTGYLLVVRTSLYITYMLTEENGYSTFLIAESSIFAFTLSIPLVGTRIYEKLYLQKLEASFILNIFILTLGTFYAKNMNLNSIRLSFFSVGVTFIKFIGIMIFYIVMGLKHWQVKAPDRIWKVIYMNMKKMFKMNSSDTNEVKNVKEASFTVTSIDIREPLLDEDISQL